MAGRVRELLLGAAEGTVRTVLEVKTTNLGIELLVADTVAQSGRRVLSSLCALVVAVGG